MIFLMTARSVVPKIQNLDPEDAYAELVDALPPSILRPTDSEEACALMNEILALAMALNPGDRCSVTEMENRLGDLLAGVQAPERPFQAEIEAVGLGEMFPDDDEPATQTITPRTLQATACGEAAAPAAHPAIP